MILQSLFDRYKVCVLIPTYNNEQTLAALINDVLSYTSDIIIVNDGATDQTAEILSTYPLLEIVSYQPNKGKGYALRKGFKHALNLGYERAITIDSDGQHYPEDFIQFFDVLEKQPDALIVGARNMTVENVPSKSNFGNRFSNFWYFVETTDRLSDTQSGFRLYPIKLIQDIKFVGNKFEFEVEVLVRSNWKGITVTETPVKVYYPKQEERVSHFRPGKDFFRISVLNTVLTTLALLWYLPLKFIKSLSVERIKSLIVSNILDSGQSNMKVSCAIAFGLFMGIVPFWGFQILLGLFFAHLLKLNKGIVVLFSNISIPPMIPLIIFGSLQLGSMIFNGHWATLSYSSDLSLESISKITLSYVIGSFSLAFIAALIGWAVSMFLLVLFRPQKNNITHG
ncbi:DUF2062 domain-containing protein [Persicobacter psychrovividus]|uniref:Glycosyl transferase n=1 Tax=Persicobacter psychrovividus TaxID=387638 RepID=A0ABN6LG29_9BACT|nr:glycosyl transferase [Persicobacter psychrovividus]